MKEEKVKRKRCTSRPLALWAEQFGCE